MRYACVWCTAPAKPPAQETKPAQGAKKTSKPQRASLQPVEEKNVEDKPAEEQNKGDNGHSGHSRDIRHTHTEPPEDKKAASTRDVDGAVADAAAAHVTETPAKQVIWEPLRAAEYIASNLSTLLQRSRASNLSTVVFFSPAGEAAGEE